MVPRRHRPSISGGGTARPVALLLLLSSLLVAVTPSRAWGSSAAMGLRTGDDGRMPFSPPRRLLILGYGRVGRAVARAVRQDPALSDVIIAATIRRPPPPTVSGDEPDGDDGVELVPYDAATTSAAGLRAYSHLLLALPLRPEDPLYERLAEAVEATEGERGAADCESSPSRLHWIGAVSSTSVYGDHGDNVWVTEEAECRGNPDYVRAEALLRGLAAPQGGAHVAVFRCAGIYGGDRSALHTAWKQRRQRRGSTAAAHDEAASGTVTNRIHVDDLAAAVVAALRGSATGVYNLADDAPAPRGVVAQHAAALLDTLDADTGATQLDEASSDNEMQTGNHGEGSSTSTPAASSSSSRRRRGTDRKLVSNQRMREELLPELKYPTYREGLAAILQDRSNPWHSGR